MAIEQNVDLIPVTFVDNKSRFPCDYLGGGPGKLRVFIHKPIPAGTYQLETIQEFKNEVFNIIDKKLSDYEGKQ